MADFRRDPITGRWVIVTQENPMGPGDFDLEPHRNPSGGSCPFCPGNERMTPPEISARRAPGSSANDRSWSIRVVPNKFPALRIEGNLDRVGIGLYDMMNGIGAHEVIIETPDHEKALADFEPNEWQELLTVWQERSLDLRKDKRFRYLLLFKNFGESAGASLAHPHTQLIALPIVPKRVVEELSHSAEYLTRRERCLFCDVIDQELSEGQRLVLETPLTVCFAPFASRFPFELWILPKKHLSHFDQSPPELIQDFGRTLKSVLTDMRSVLGDPSYNFLIHTAPLEGASSEGYHWHLEMIPRLTPVAGFEWGSGFYINPTPPEQAVEYLRKKLA